MFGFTNCEIDGYLNVAIGPILGLVQKDVDASRARSTLMAIRRWEVLPNNAIFSFPQTGRWSGSLVSLSSLG